MKTTKIVALASAGALALGLMPMATASAAEAVTALAPHDAKVGAAANVTGTVDGAAKGVKVEAQVKLDNGTWSTSRSGTTDADGKYSLPLTFASDHAGKYTFRVIAATKGGQKVSNSFSLVRVPTIQVSSVSTKPLGQYTSLWGVVHGLGNVKVSSQVKLPNGSYSTSSAATSNGKGGFTIPVTYGVNAPGSYTFRTVVNFMGTNYASNEVTMQRTVPTLAISASSAGSRPAGVDTNIWGTAQGAPAGTRVTLQAWVNGGWSTSNSGTTDGRGFYAIPATFAAMHPGTYSFRTVFTAYGQTRISNTVKLTRTNSRPSYIDARCVVSGRALCINKSTRKLYYVVNGTVVKTMDARFGNEGNPTREGQFSLYWKSRNHVSTLYWTPMPYAMFFSGGEAVHYSSDFAARGYNGNSHGCVNIRDKSGIAWLFDQVREGDRVVVYH